MSDVKPESEEDRQKSCSVQSIPFLLMSQKKKKKVGDLYFQQFKLFCYILCIFCPYFVETSLPLTSAIISMLIGEIAERCCIQGQILPKHSILQDL